MSWNYRDKKMELIDASKEAYDILVDALKEPINLDELNDDKIRAAIQAKKIALTDAIDFLKEIENLEKSLGITSDGANIEEKTEWRQGHAERMAKRV